MFELKNFDNWIEDIESGKFGSGASEKIWLINPETNEKGLFKFPKVKSDGTITGEYWAEKLATEIGKLIDVECARVDIGTYKGRIGSMSYNMLNDITSLTEGVEFILGKYPYYNKNKLLDEYSGDRYSIQMIENSLPESIEMQKILQMVIFDCLIGNSDRHHSNWGEIDSWDYKEPYFIFHCDIAPLYDNGSSLCSYINESDIDIILKDNMQYEAIINTKSKSTIGWKNTRPIRHFELITNIRKTYYGDTIDFVENIKEKVNEESIENILCNFNNDIISEKMKNLLRKFIIDRKNRIINIYDLDSGV